MPPATAERLVTRLVEGIREQGIEVETGSFGAEMQVHLVNDGPVTLLLDSRSPSCVGRPTDTDDA
jgi:D-tyrosyl-tRNA(Tyr) deacylase